MNRDPLMDAQMIAERLTPPLHASYALPEMSQARHVPSLAAILDELSRLRTALDRAYGTIDSLRQERADVVAILGRPIKDGELGWAVRVWGGLG